MKMKKQFFLISTLLVLLGSLTVSAATMNVVSDTSVKIVGVYNKAGGPTNYVDLTGSPLNAVRAQEPKPYPTGYVSEGPEVTNSVWDNGASYDFETNAPTADWIWETERAEGPANYDVADPLYDAAAYTNGRVVVFEKTFDITGTPTSGSIHVTADNAYEVWVNGNYIARSPTAKVAGWETSDMHESSVATTGWQSVGNHVIDAGYLVDGENTLTILAGNEYFWSDDGNSPSPALSLSPYYQYNPGAMIFSMDVDYTECTPTDEVCDGVDNDCDGSIDEGLTQPTTCGIGECAASGELQCIDGQEIDTCEPGQPTTEICDGLDNDCDGSTDEDYVPTPTTCGIGECAASGELQCIDGQEIDTCEPGQPTTEICDGLDNNCNGATDELNICMDCTLTQGYWKTHSAYGKAPYDPTWSLVEDDDEDTLFFQSGQTWYEVFWTAPKGGNAYYQLAHQYMAAKLNLLAMEGAYPPEIVTALSEAEALFVGYTPATMDDLKGKTAKAVRSEFQALASELASFNEGSTYLPHCDDQDYCVPMTLFQIGDIEASQLDNPMDEFNYPDYGLSIDKPAFDDPFIVGVSPVGNFPWNSNFVNPYATDFDVVYNYMGYNPNAVLTVGWSTGKSGEEQKQVILNGIDLGTTIPRTGTPTSGWYNQWPGYVDTFEVSNLASGTNVFNMLHLSGDGTAWDYLTLESVCPTIEPPVEE